jgi:hypothetical protein
MDLTFLSAISHHMRPIGELFLLPDRLYVALRKLRVSESAFDTVTKIMERDDERSSYYLGTPHFSFQLCVLVQLT